MKYSFLIHNRAVFRTATGTAGSYVTGTNGCQNISYVHNSRKHWKCKYFTIWIICAFRVLSPHKTVCWHLYICLNYSFESDSGNQAYKSGVGPILSVVSVVVPGIGRGVSCRARIGQPGRTG